MTDGLVPLGDGHTALTDEDRQGLLPTYISTRSELFDAEQANVSKALLRRPPPLARLLDDKYLRDLHHAMFGEVWSWAGTYRRAGTNIGIPVHEIPAAVRDLVEDARAWVEHATFDADELTVRFHHRLVAIHPFPNGNGRHGRVATDLLLRGLGQRPFTWGSGLDVDTPTLRRTYIGALRAADRGDVMALAVFVRS